MARGLKLERSQTLGAATTFSTPPIRMDAGGVIQASNLWLNSTVALHAANYWSAVLHNETQGVDVSAALTNETAAFTADTARAFTLSGTIRVAKGDMLRLVVTKAASAVDLSAIYINWDVEVA